MSRLKLFTGVGNSLVNSVGNWSSTNQTEHNENFLETSQENCVGTYQPCGNTNHESVVLVVYSIDLIIFFYTMYMFFFTHCKILN